MRPFLARMPARLAAAALCVALAAPAQAQVNTGEFSSAGLDVYWSALAGQVTNPAGGTAAWVIDPADQHPNWVEPPASSRWITMMQGWEFEAPDDIWTTYFMSFTLGTPAGFTLAGNWATDNNATLWLNGVQMGSLGFTSFTSLTPFELSSGFVSGTNTLAVQVYNGTGSGNPSGLLMSDLDGSVVPEPATLVLLGTGLLGLAVVARRRRDDDAEV